MKLYKVAIDMNIELPDHQKKKVVKAALLDAIVTEIKLFNGKVGVWVDFTETSQDEES